MRSEAETVLPPQYLDCLRHIDQPFFTPVYDFCLPSLVFGRVALVGDAASTARPHIGFGIAKAGAEAQVLAEALSDYALAHHAFEPVLLRHAEQRFAVIERFRMQQHGAVEPAHKGLRRP
jgi:2-polyprenyl-6-methoxyphenol hydroxylase-like FAD-dependent oxidoreductase